MHSWANTHTRIIVFVATNALMSFMVAQSMFAGHSWLAGILPGQFHSGGDNSGYLVFFSIVGMIDAMMIIAVALSEILPALHTVWQGDLDTLRRRLSGKVPVDIQRGLLEEARSELQLARNHAARGRLVLAGGLLSLLIVFPCLSFSFANALPQGSLFVEIFRDASSDSFCGPRAVPNSVVTLGNVERFTADQVAQVVLPGFSDVYAWHFGAYRPNRQNVIFAAGCFLFRLGLLGLVIILLVCLRLPDTREEDQPLPVE